MSTPQRSLDPAGLDQMMADEQVAATMRKKIGELAAESSVFKVGGTAHLKNTDPAAIREAYYTVSVHLFESRVVKRQCPAEEVAVVNLMTKELFDICAKSVIDARSSGQTTVRIPNACCDGFACVTRLYYECVVDALTH